MLVIAILALCALIFLTIKVAQRLVYRSMFNFSLGFCYTSKRKVRVQSMAINISSYGSMGKDLQEPNTASEQHIRTDIISFKSHKRKVFKFVYSLEAGYWHHAFVDIHL